MPENRNKKKLQELQSHEQNDKPHAKQNDVISFPESDINEPISLNDLEEIHSDVTTPHRQVSYKNYD